MATGLEWSHERKDGVDLLTLEGRLDTVSSPLLDQQIKQLIGAGSTKMVLDFAAIEYLSSAGMRTILSAAKQLKAQEGALVLCGMTPSVLDLIHMAGFDSLLTIEQTVNAAINRIRS